MTDAPTAPTWPDLLRHRSIARQDLTSAQTAWAMAEIMSGAASTPQVAAFLVALQDQGRDRRRADRPRRHDARARASASRSPGARSTSSAPAATARTPSTSRRCPPSSSPAPGSPSSSTATARRRRPPGSADVLEALGIRLDHPPARVAELADRGRASRSASRRCSTPRSGTPPRRAPSWASGRPSTSSARSPTRPSRGPRRSASPTRGWRRSWPASSRSAGSSALVFRGEDGLDEIAPTGPDPALGGARRRRHRVGRSTGRPTSASPASTLGVLRGAEGRRTTPTSRVGCSTARPAPCARPWCSTPLRRSWPTAPCPGPADGTLVERLRAGRASTRAHALDSGAAADVLARWRRRRERPEPRAAVRSRPRPSALRAAQPPLRSALSPRARGRTPARGRAGSTCGTRCRSGCAGRPRSC